MIRQSLTRYAVRVVDRATGEVVVLPNVHARTPKEAVALAEQSTRDIEHLAQPAGTVVPRAQIASARTKESHPAG